MKSLLQKSIRVIASIFGGFKKGHYLAHFKTLLSLAKAHAILFVKAVENHQAQLSNQEEVKLEKLHRLSMGLHSLMLQEPRFSFSILIAAEGALEPRLFKQTLQAALRQTPSEMEVLVGYCKESIIPVTELCQDFSDSQKLKIFCYDSSQNILNCLAKEAKGNYLAIVGPQDWIRPDLLFRYEQTLRLLPTPEKKVLSCYELKRDQLGRFVAGSELRKTENYPFPYVFEDEISSHFLIPKALWLEAGGIKEANGFYDLALRLDLAGAEIHTIPFFLYAHRHKRQASSRESIIESLTAYALAKGLDWKIVPGMVSASCRAIPQIYNTPQIQVIIPFKDQKELTLKAVHSILCQKGVKPFITAVDNNSYDHSIRDELSKLGAEVLVINEPFNYSRLNNLAAKNTQTAKHCETLLFLNNDVELEEDALLEMSRWIDQPQIGIVGCRLHFPNNLLQHGGIDLMGTLPNGSLGWQNTGSGKRLDQCKEAQILRITDAVTAACALIKRKTFQEIEGFDEIWYPIAYSDTNLAVKLRAKKLYPFYTPYAKGTHHESLTRQLNHIEDYEASAWLNQKYLEHNGKTLL